MKPRTLMGMPVVEDEQIPKGHFSVIEDIMYIAVGGWDDIAALLEAPIADRPKHCDTPHKENK